MKTLAKNLLLTAAMTGFVWFCTGRFSDMEKGADFPEFYSAARMVAAGMGSHLYEASIQEQFEGRYTGRVGTLFNHPPFELLFYLPFCGSTMEHAYLLWSLLNVMLLIAIARVLGGNLFPNTDWRLLLACMLSFAPVLLNFLQGQDAILLLFFEVMAFVALSKDSAAIAGIFLACGLFKFHLVLPLGLIILPIFPKKLRFLFGFCATATVLFLASSAVSGWEWMIAYSRLLLWLKDVPLAGIHPQAMANLRGLISLVLSKPEPRAVVIAALSTLLVILAVGGWHETSSDQRSKLALAGSALASVLVSYHLSPHDLTLLLLPMALILDHERSTDVGPRWLSYALLGTVIALFLPPLHIFLLGKDAYVYLSVPLLLLFFAVQARIRWTPESSRTLP